MNTAFSVKPEFRLLPRLLFVGLAILLVRAVIVQAAPPVISNIRAQQRAGTHYVDIYYNLSDPDSAGPFTVHVLISDNAGQDYLVPVFTLKGALGAGVMPGLDRHVEWNAGADWGGRFSDQCKVKIFADDNSAPPAPKDMAYIPGGIFSMGGSAADDGADTKPVHVVYVRGFFMDKYEVYKEQWIEVYSWATNHGYSFDQPGTDSGDRHPVQSITWYDMVKWCNARSQKENLTPVYYTDANKTSIYRSGQVNVANTGVKWDAPGYRLPTEAEWEKAARGGLAGKLFPWGDSIDASQANYGKNYQTPALTSVVGSYSPNGYGLFDMAGNVWEWCWDWYADNYYWNTDATKDNPCGPTTGTYRVLRGGSWNNAANDLRCAYRSCCNPSNYNIDFGFRCVRGY